MNFKDFDRALDAQRLTPDSEYLARYRQARKRPIRRQGGQ